MDVIARVIGEAAIRLVAEGGPAFRRSVQQEFRKAGADGSIELFRDTEVEAEKSATKSARSFSGAFEKIGGSLGSAGGSLASITGLGAKVSLLGTAAVGAAGAATSLGGVIGSIGAAAFTATGALGPLPAVFAAVKIGTAAVKLGLDGMEESFSALAEGDVEAFNESLKDLAPSAQNFAKAVRDVKPGFDGLKLDVQQELFRGLSDVVAPLSDRYMPLLNSTFTDVARSINGAGREAATFASDGEVVGQVANFTYNVRDAFKELVPSIQPALSAILDIGETGSQFLPGFANWVSEIAARFGEFIRIMASSGALYDFFSNGLSLVGDFGSAFRDLFVGIKNIFSNISADANSFSSGFANAAASFRAFTESGQGASAIANIFAVVQSVAATLLPVVLQLAGAIGTTLAPAFLQVAQVVGPALAPVIAALSQALTSIAPALVTVGTGFAAFLGGIAPALPAVGQLVGVLGQLAGAVLTAAGPAIGQLAQVFAGVLATALPPLIPVISQLVTVVGSILGAVAPLLGPLLQLVGAVLSPLLTVFQALVPPIQLVVSTLSSSLQPVIQVLGEALGQLGAALAPVASALGEALVTAITALVPILPPVVQIVSALLQALLPILPAVISLIQPISQLAAILANVLVGAVSIVMSVLTPLIALITGVLSTAISTVSGLISGVLSFVVGLVQDFVTFFTGAWTGLANAFSAIVNGIANFVASAFTGIANTATNIWNGIVNSITNFVNRLLQGIRDGFNNAVTAAGNALSSLRNAVSSGVDNVIGFFTGLPGRILDSLGPFGSILVSAGRNLIEGLINGIKQAASRIADAVLAPVKSAVAGVKDFLGIQSPSRLMAEIGRDTGDGFVLGIEDTYGATATAMTGLGELAAQSLRDSAREMSAPIDLAPVGAGVTTTAGGNVTFYQTNQMLPGSDVRQFADAVYRRGQSALASGPGGLQVRRQGVQDGVDDGRVFPGGVV